jgi:hypothetical protein
MGAKYRGRFYGGLLITGSNNIDIGKRAARSDDNPARLALCRTRRYAHSRGGAFLSKIGQGR